VIEEEFDGPNVMLDLFGEGQGGANETRQALPQGIVESFEVIRFPGVLRDGFVALRWDDALIDVIVIRVKRCVCLIDFGDRGPQGFGTLAAAVTDVKREGVK
jgi:hypothetical protein